MSAVAAILAIAVPAFGAHHHPRPCQHRFTIADYQRFIRTRERHGKIPDGSHPRMWLIERCQRHRGPARHAAIVWRIGYLRGIRQILAHPFEQAVASWYYDQGTTGCGFHATYGIATFVVPCGGQVVLRGPGGTVVATRDDSGPYVAGRSFDLDPAVKAAIGCSDLCAVGWARP